MFQWYKKMRDDLALQLEEEAKTKVELSDARKQIIKLQQELIHCKDQQLKSVQATVKTSVEETMKTELKSYSATVKAHQPSYSPTIPAETVKTLVKTIVEEEDRSRCVVVFGLPEEEEEEQQNLTANVEELLLEIGEKPRLEATRIGKVKPGNTRPVKITVGSSVVAAQILSKARLLANSEKSSRVFISPDLSPSQRLEHRALVKSLKEKRLSEPTKKHFIKDSTIISVDRSKT